MLIELFNENFRRLFEDSTELAANIGEESLFSTLDAERSFEQRSAGELLVRSAAVVERTMGGITRRLWDDPFEWTLPESLASRDKILEYISEVENSRVEAFRFFRSDHDLFANIPAPEKLRPIAAVLLDAITDASVLHGRAAGMASRSRNLGMRKGVDS